MPHSAGHLVLLYFSITDDDSALNDFLLFMVSNDSYCPYILL